MWSSGSPKAGSICFRSVPSFRFGLSLSASSFEIEYVERTSLGRKSRKRGCVPPKSVRLRVRPTLAALQPSQEFLDCERHRNVMAFLRSVLHSRRRADRKQAAPSLDTAWTNDDERRKRRFRVTFRERHWFPDEETS